MPTSEPSQRAGVSAFHLYLKVLFWFLISLLCKTGGIMFPVVILLHAWWRRGRIGRSDVFRSVPFLALSAVLGAVTFWFQVHRSIAAEAFLPTALDWRLACTGLTSAFYFCKAVVPVGLLTIYPRWAVDPGRWVQFLPWLAGAAVAAWLWSRRSGRGRGVLFGLGFFFVNLAPVSGFLAISHMRFAWAMDHLAYVPLLGLAGLAAAGAGLLRRPAVLGFLAGCLLLFCALQSRRYAENYRSEVALWRYTLSHNSHAWLADNNLGSILLLAGQPLEAIPILEAAVREKPDYAFASNNLGNALLKAGRLDGAIAAYRRAVALRPDAAVMRNNLGLALNAAGRVTEAVEQMREAVRLDPANSGAHNNLGVFLGSLGRMGEAAPQFELAVRANPGNAEAHANLGATLAGAGHLREAVTELEEALRLDPHQENAQRLLDQTLRKLGRVDGGERP